MCQVTFCWGIMRASQRERVGVNQFWGIIRSEWIAWVSISIIWLPSLFRNFTKTHKYKGGREIGRKRETIAPANRRNIFESVFPGVCMAVWVWRTTQHKVVVVKSAYHKKKAFWNHAFKILNFQFSFLYLNVSAAVFLFLIIDTSFKFWCSSLLHWKPVLSFDHWNPLIY